MPQHAKMTPPRNRPNSVASFVSEDDSHYIKPYAGRGDTAAAFRKLKEIVGGMPRVTVEEDTPEYFRFVTRSKFFRFPDICECKVNGDVIDLKFAAVYGYRDFDANRKRAEWIREQLDA